MFEKKIDGIFENERCGDATIFEMLRRHKGQFDYPYAINYFPPVQPSNNSTETEEIDDSFAFVTPWEVGNGNPWDDDWYEKLLSLMVSSA